jgi:hypothetical protein
MYWPSMTSFAPPPVTPSLKLPPRFGFPVAPPPDEVLVLVSLPPPHADSPEASRAAPPAPTTNWRRDTGEVYHLRVELSLGLEAALPDVPDAVMAPLSSVICGVVVSRDAAIGVARCAFTSRDERSRIMMVLSTVSRLHLPERSLRVGGCQGCDHSEVLM